MPTFPMVCMSDALFITHKSTTDDIATDYGNSSFVFPAAVTVQ